MLSEVGALVEAISRGDWKILYNSNGRPVDLAPLDTVGWLADQPGEFKEWVAVVGRWQTYAAGQFIYHAGDPADGLYGLGSGGLDIEFPLLADEPVLLQRAEVGFWIGDVAELSTKPRQVSLTAASPTRLLQIPSNAIHQLLEQHPQYWKAFYQLNAINMAKALTVIAEVLALTVRARLCRTLLSLSSTTNEIGVSQEHLSRLLGVTRPTLRRCLADLECLGGVTSHYRQIRIQSRTVLSAYINEQ